jgi:ribosome biogenesis GTPase
MKGLVLRSTGSFYDVLGDDQQKYSCKVRGKIRLEDSRETNPVAVGDWVTFEKEKDVGSILEILPRRNHILRKSVKKTSHSHVLAANVDQVMLIVTLAFPRTSTGFIDRFLVTAEAFRIPQIIVFNKVDRLDDELLEIQRGLVELYSSLGVQTFETCALEDVGDNVKKILDGKITLVAGHSGVGKSTILNQLSSDIQQKTGAVSGFSEKGMHTTTFAEMFPVDANTFVIDTPGIKEWGLIDMVDQEVSDYFPEMREIRLNCKFGSKCIHVNEPKCAVIDAVKSGAIALTRYESYISILVDEDNRN